VFTDDFGDEGFPGIALKSSYYKRVSLWSRF
jgi:hypothetical protein